MTEKKFPRVWLGPEDYDDSGAGIGIDVSPVKTERHRAEAMLVAEHRVVCSEASKMIDFLTGTVLDLEGKIKVATTALEKIALTEGGKKVVGVSRSGAVKNFNRQLRLARDALLKIR